MIRQSGVRTREMAPLFKTHPLFEARDGKRERLKQSASKLACQKRLNQYPSSTNTTLQSFHPRCCHPAPPFLSTPTGSLLLPPFLLHSCTLVLFLSCYSLQILLPPPPPPPSSSSDRAKIDRCIGREMQREEDGNQRWA